MVCVEPEQRRPSRGQKEVSDDRSRPAALLPVELLSTAPSPQDSHPSPIGSARRCTMRRARRPVQPSCIGIGPVPPGSMSNRDKTYSSPHSTAKANGIMSQPAKS